MARLLRPLYAEVSQRETKNYFPERAIVGTFPPDDIAVTDVDTDNEDLPDRGSASAQRGDTWPPMTPLYNDAGDWRIWRVGQTIDGFLIGMDGHSTDGEGRLQLHATLDVQGLLMLIGDVDATDVILPPDPTTASMTQAALDAALQAGPRDKGLQVYNIAGVR